MTSIYQTIMLTLVSVDTGILIALLVLQMLHMLDTYPPKKRKAKK